MARRRRVFSNRRLTGLRGSRWWPLLMALMVILALGLAYALVFHGIVPLFSAWFGGGEAPLMPTPSPEQIGDLSGRIQEVLLTSQFKHVSVPVLLGDTLFFASGSDNAQNPLLNKIFVATTQNANAATPKVVEGIEAQHGYILHLDVNAKYIVFFDGKRTGGGALKAYDRDTLAVWTLYEADYGTIEPKLMGPTKCIFTARTSLDPVVETLYSLDILTGEATTLCVYRDSPMGTMGVGVSGTDVVFVREDPAHKDSERYNQIVVQPASGEAARLYSPSLFAYNPVSNGNAIAFSDALNERASLYLSVGGAMQKKIAQNVSGYGLGENFLAYGVQGRLYVYFWEENKTYQVSKAGEYAMLASVGKHGVTWFDITAEIRERDILKFAILD